MAASSAKSLATSVILGGSAGVVAGGPAGLRGSIGGCAGIDW